MDCRLCVFLILLLFGLGLFEFALAAGAAEKPLVDDRAGVEREWGFRPAPDEETQMNPPAFVWRPQDGARTYFLQVSKSQDFSQTLYQAAGLELNVHTPPEPLPSSELFWRYAFETASGEKSRWSKVRRFIIPPEAIVWPKPPKEELISRVPQEHPRLFLRPEDIPALRAAAKGALKEEWRRLQSEAEKILQNPPPVEEPPPYPTKKRDLDIWWGNRRRTIAVTNGAATLAFCYMLSGEERYGQEARRLLLAAMEWDPKGPTGYRYNDEAGMPFAYFSARAYTWCYPLLSEEDKEKIRRVMRIRGMEIYDHLIRSKHTWRPFASHRNRAWHYLGEVAIAFLREIPEAEDWLDYVVNIFYAVYPVWCDEDGGWHEGISYWNAYVNRVTWWLDVAKSALDIDGFKKPFFHKTGYYCLYMSPPGAKTSGFGDLTSYRPARRNKNLMATLARMVQNPHFQWYAEQMPGKGEGGYLGFLRARKKKPEPRAPSDLPPARVFWGTGLAALHSDLLDYSNDIHFMFKSSPFGSQSHGFNAQNSFLLSVYGEPIFIYSGRRDYHGSPHHKEWMWHTRSDNSILVDGQGQIKHSGKARGKIVNFIHRDECDYLVGDATEAYGHTAGRLPAGLLQPARPGRFTRTVLFWRPGTIIIYDQLKAPKPSTYQWCLHTLKEMEIRKANIIIARNGQARTKVQFLQPEKLKFTQTDKLSPPPGRGRKVVQWHLTASTERLATTQEFITLLLPFREGKPEPEGWRLEAVQGGYGLALTTPEEKKVVLLRLADAESPVRAFGLETDAELAAGCIRQGKLREVLRAGGTYFKVAK